MAKAYKCDSCGEFFDNAALPDFRRYHIQDMGPLDSTSNVVPRKMDICPICYRKLLELIEIGDEEKK